MKIKLSQLEILDIIFSELVKKDLAFELSFKIADFVSVLVEKIKTFSNERIKLCEKFSTKDEAGHAVVIVKGNQKEYDIEDKLEFGRKSDELFNMEIELNFIPFKKNDFKTIQIKPEFIISLRDLGFLEK
jgi:hypothetical protein